MNTIGFQVIGDRIVPIPRYRQLKKFEYCNYSPDWAIAFEQDKVKHIYFVAETKGSMSSMDIRGIEKSKIACAEKLFKLLSTKEVVYDKITSYDDLMSKVK